MLAVQIWALLLEGRGSCRIDGRNGGGKTAKAGILHERSWFHGMCRHAQSRPSQQLRAFGRVVRHHLELKLGRHDSCRMMCSVAFQVWCALPIRVDRRLHTAHRLSVH